MLNLPSEYKTANGCESDIKPDDEGHCIKAEEIVNEKKEVAKNGVDRSIRLGYTYISKIHYKFNRLDVLNMFTEITVYY